MERNVYMPTKDKPYRLQPKPLTDKQKALAEYVSTSRKVSMQDVRTLAYELYQACLINNVFYEEIIKDSYSKVPMECVCAFNSILFSANEALCGKIIYPDNKEG